MNGPTGCGDAGGGPWGIGDLVLILHRVGNVPVRRGMR
jgi:hypothetical protein